MSVLEPSAAGDTVRRWNRGVSLRALAVLPRKLAAWIERRRQRRMVERIKARIAEAVEAGAFHNADCECCSDREDAAPRQSRQ